MKHGRADFSLFLRNKSLLKFAGYCFSIREVCLADKFDRKDLGLHLRPSSSRNDVSVPVFLALLANLHTLTLPTFNFNFTISLLSRYVHILKDY